MKFNQSQESQNSPKISRAQIVALLTILAISGGALAAEKWRAVGEQRRKVQWVIDGDTFKVCPDGNSCNRNEQISIRLQGLECPESSQQACDRKPDADCDDWIPLGKKAKKYAIKKLKNQKVNLVPTGPGGHFKTGGYNRPLAYVGMPDGTDYGLHMIKKGLCQDFSYRYPHPRSAQYKKAQKHAGVFPVKKGRR